MTASVDVFFSFRSPYSYLATYDLVGLRRDLDITLRLRPVLPVALRTKATLFGKDRKPVDYIVMDVKRRARMLGRPFRFPSPDPVVQDMATFAVAGEQPHIHRLNHLGLEAERRGKGIDFACHVTRLIWGGTRGWDQGDLLAEAVAEAGLDLAELDAACVATDPSPEIEANHAALDAAGHWGVPTMVYEGEPFFGQDRVDTLRWRLESAGVSRRSAAGVLRPGPAPAPASPSSQSHGFPGRPREARVQKDPAAQKEQP